MYHVTKKDNLFHYAGSNRKGGQKGVGFLIKAEYIKSTAEIRGTSDRITTLKLIINNRNLRVYIHYGEAILGLNNRTRHPIG